MKSFNSQIEQNAKLFHKVSTRSPCIY